MNKVKFVSLFVVGLLLQWSIVMAVQGVDELKAIPECIDVLSRKIPVTLITLHDPSTIVLKYSKNGEFIYTEYEAEKYFETLFTWVQSQNKSGEPRQMHLCYTFKNGVELVDELSEKRFLLPGKMDYHPIDYATALLGSKFYTTYEMMDIQKLSRKAWDQELNRVYQYLGGAKNIPLRDMQRQWIKFRDAKIKFIGIFYSKKQGSIWGPICSSKVTVLTRTQVEFLQDMLAW